jgi:hypothetical protein
MSSNPLNAPRGGVLRLGALAVLVALAIVCLQAATSANAPVRQPDKLVILSTVDVKGKTSPCG